MANVERVINIVDNHTVLIDNTTTNALIYIDSKEANIKFDISEGIHHILIVNRYEAEEVTIKDEGKVYNHAVLNLSYIDLCNNNLVQDSNIDVYEGSELNIITKYLSKEKKTINMNYVNKERYSNINIDNSCVCLDKSEFYLECVGKIERGSYTSESHQTSRCLTIDKPKKSLVKPVLLIDENDVLASHSLSSGSIDEDILYYLNSRGISYKDAMVLFIRSYLLPSEKLLSNYEFGQEVYDYLVERVENLYA